MSSFDKVLQERVSDLLAYESCSRHVVGDGVLFLRAISRSPFVV